MAHFPLTVIVPATVGSMMTGDELAARARDRIAAYRRYEADGALRAFPCGCDEEQRTRSLGAFAREATPPGGWAERVASFVSEHGGPPAFAGLAATDPEADEHWRRYRAWLERWEVFLARTGLAKERRFASLPAARAACARCKGTGVYESDFWFGRFDYATVDEDRWRELNRARHYAESSGGMTSGAVLKSAAKRAPELWGTDLVLKDGSWLHAEAGVWGIYELPAEQRHLVFYAGDERWPLLLSETVVPGVEDDDLCVALDCHT